MKKYTTEDLELANELLADQNAKDQFGQRLWSWSNIQWAILVQMWFDKMIVLATKLHRRFRFTLDICLRWVLRAANEGTINQLKYY